MSDLIERSAAIDALEKVSGLFPWKVPGNRDSYDRYNEAWNDAIGRAEIEIEELPSAQPDKRTEERTETHACDLIERQAVLNELYDWEMCYTWDEHCREEYGAKYIVSPSDVIMKLPSAQPERKIELHGDESAIEILSELRSWFSCFDEKEGLAYHALSLAIRAINANHDARSERKRGGVDKKQPRDNEMQSMRICYKRLGLAYVQILPELRC